MMYQIRLCLEVHLIGCIVISASVLTNLCAQDSAPTQEILPAKEHVIDFENVTVGKPTPRWSEQGVTFELAHQPKRSKAAGRIMFFPHLGTDRKGILNAMANEAIPVRATFDRPARLVKVVMWGSTTSSAWLEAYDSQGNLLAKEGLDQVPVRSKPEEQIPFFALQLEADGIAYVEISGSQPGGFVAVDEFRWIYKE
ncbi:hypothetical protein SH449x_002143 [Pirellulaceae bacterium SH449]